MTYRIEYSPEVEAQLAALPVREQAIVLDTVERRLLHQPSFETRNRKRMRPNPLAPWELRVGRLRVYYDVEETPEPVVRILAVGKKEHNRIRIGKKELEL